MLVVDRSKPYLPVPLHLPSDGDLETILAICIDLADVGLAWPLKSVGPQLLIAGGAYVLLTKSVVNML